MKYGFNLQSLINETENTVFNKEDNLSYEQEERLKAQIKQIDEEISSLEEMRLKLGRLLDYNAVKNDGFSVEDIRAFAAEDEEYVEKINELYDKNLYMRDYMFGYPVNMQDYSYTSQYCRNLESRLYLMNNCGDPYQLGNYGMDGKEIEKQIVDTFAKIFGLTNDKYWGYITTGGTESNFWALREGYCKFPNGKFYYSEDAHYSVDKFLSSSVSKFCCQKIDTDGQGAIDVEKLKSAILEDKTSKDNGVIIILTWGTTCRGNVDDVKAITEFLLSEGIPYYCHLDAAHYGGIPQNQKSAPTLKNVVDLNVDSVSVSLHKYIGTARVNGVLLSLSRSRRNYVDYIGQEDSTFLGSRDYMPFSTLQRTREILHRTPPETYILNVEFFENELKVFGVSFERVADGNIFILDKPSDEICKKYQLASFKDTAGNDKCHVIIYPFHKRDIMKQLAEELAKSEK